MAFATQDPRVVAEAALVAWTSHDAKGLLAVAHPELLVRLRSAKLALFYVTDDPDKGKLLASGSNAEVVSVFCEALKAIIPARDPRLDYFDRYIETDIKGNLAIVVFDSGFKRKSDGLIESEYKKEIVLKKNGDEWRFLWSPEVWVNVDLDWDPRKKNA